MERTSGGLTLWLEDSEGFVARWEETGAGWWHAPGFKSGEGCVQIVVVSVWQRSFLRLTEPCLCPVWLRNAGVLGDRRALCGPYFTAGCLEAAHRAAATHSTAASCVTVTPGVEHENLSTQESRGLSLTTGVRSSTNAELLCLSDSVDCRFKYMDFSLFAWQLESCGRGHCVYVSQLEYGLGVVGERQRGELVQLCEGLGLNPAEDLSRTHTSRSRALSHMHTMRRRRPGLGPGQWALGSHTLEQCYTLTGTQTLGPCRGARSGRPLAALAQFSSTSLWQDEDSWRYFFYYFIFAQLWIECRCFCNISTTILVTTCPARERYFYDLHSIYIRNLYLFWKHTWYIYFPYFSHFFQLNLVVNYISRVLMAFSLFSFSPAAKVIRPWPS